MMMRVRRLLPGLLVPALLMAPAPTAAQIPEEFKNLQVLPKDIEQEKLVQTMRGFASALGLRCWGCHVGEEGKPLSTFDFASDEKQEKKIAREMIKMVQGINKTVGGIDTGHDEKVIVTCATCHHGMEKPRSIDGLLAKEYEAGGLDAALGTYKELRDKYYGGYQFDFGVGPLNMLAEDLGKSGKMEDAVRVQELNAELHPQDSLVHAALGMLYAQAGDKEKGIAALEKALALDPGNGWAKQQLERLKK